MLNELSKITEQLLVSENLVVWPNIGAFVVGNKPAQLKDNGQFLPPLRFISFNNKLKANDAILLNAYALEKSITYTESEKFYDQFYNKFIEVLNKGKAINAEGFGSFKMVDNNIQFEVSKSFKLDSAKDYGLPVLNLSPVQAQRAEKSKRKLAWIPAAAIAIPLLGAALVFSNENARTSVEASIWSFGTEAVYKNNTSNLSKEVIEESTVNNSISLPDSYFENSHSILNVEGTELVLHNEAFENEMKGKYLLVAGCFKSLKNAENFAAKLKDKGIDAGIYGKQIGLYRVCAGVENNRRQALKAVRNLRTEYPIARKAWVTVYE